MFDYDSFCFHCVLGLMAEGPGSLNYEKASGEYWQDQFDQEALETPPFWKTPLKDLA